MELRFPICRRLLDLALLSWLQQLYVDGQAITSVQTRPTYIYDEEGKEVKKALPPSQLTFAQLKDNGEFDAFRYASRFLHIGCFRADMSISKFFDDDGGVSYDPQDCVEKCLEKYPEIPSDEVIAAVHEKHCGCVVPGDGDGMTVFDEGQPEQCTYICKLYQNPICGGPNSYWGVFKEYDFKSLGSQGAYDPWRYIWYTVVVVKETTIQGASYATDGEVPERYFLHAIDAQYGEAKFQFQSPLNGIIHGLTYDIDSTRLVGVFNRKDVGRVNRSDPWEYQLATIKVNTALAKVELIPSFYPIEITMPVSNRFMIFTGATAIIGTKDVFIFTQAEPATLKTNIKDRMYIVAIPNGKIIHEATLDFRVMQILANEKYGDVTALGPRKQKTAYLAMARVTMNDAGQQLVDWQYNPINVIPVGDEGELQSLHLFPGISCSEHLLNKSFIAFKKYPRDGVRDPAKSGPTVMQIDIRDGRTKPWCNQEECTGTMPYRITQPALYNKNPRIPLALGAPELKSARFTMDGSSIEIEFDRSTLKGALPEDINDDMVPDRINTEVAHRGQFDCAKLFAEDTVKKLGEFPDTTCEWATNSKVIVTFLEKFDVEVGEFLFLKADVVFTTPKNGEYSIGASGGIPVTLPDPLEDPVILTAGPLRVDECSPVNIDATTSMNTGGKPIYSWTLLEQQDLTNRPDRVYNETKLQQFKDVLESVTNDNKGRLEMDSGSIEPATVFVIELNITSRWGRTSTKELQLTKLDFPAPMVTIDGPAEIEKKRTEEITLVAKGEPSKCAAADQKLGFRWTETSGKLKFEDFPEIIPTTPNLKISKFVLSPPPKEDKYSERNTYTFTVECFVATDPTKASSSTVKVIITRSPIHVAFSSESRKVTKTDILVLDARESQDPDDPTFPGQTFKGTFAWTCLKPDRTPCEGAEPSTGALTKDLLTDCRKDTSPDSKFFDGGKAFNRPQFDEQSFCRYRRGVVMFDTTEFDLGEYKFEVAIATEDGRTAKKDIRIKIVLTKVPRLILQVQGEKKELYPVTDTIKIKGTIENDPDGAIRETAAYDWRITANLINDDYDADIAKDREGTSNPYLVEQYTYKDITDDFNIDDTSKFEKDPSNPILVIKPNVLKSDYTYGFKIVVSNSSDPNAETGEETITIHTCGKAPQGGSLVIEPSDGEISTPRTLTADGWTAKEVPITYLFGYEMPSATGALAVAFHAAATTVQRYSIKYCPGTGDPDNNYALTVYVDIMNKCGATYRQHEVITCRPAENTTAFKETLAEEAENAPPEEQANIANTMMDLDQSDDATDSATDSIGKSMEGPMTEEGAKGTAAALGNLAKRDLSPERMDAATDLLEEGAAQMINGGYIDDDVAHSLFNAISSLQSKASDSTTFERGGRRARIQSLPKSNMGMRRDDAPKFEARTITGAGGSKTNHMTDRERRMQAKRVRQKQNHPARRPGRSVLAEGCDSVFCDIVGLFCIEEKRRSDTSLVSICCDRKNEETLCGDPPCWFDGNLCPPKPHTHEGQGDVSDWDRTSEHYDYIDHAKILSPEERRLSEERRLAEQRTLQGEKKAVSQSPNCTGENWYKSGPCPTRIAMLQDNEALPLSTWQKYTEERQQEVLDDMQIDARQAIVYANMDDQMANRMRKKDEERREDDQRYVMELRRNYSQMLTRTNVVRDLVAKQLIKTMVRGEPPKMFPLANGDKLSIGKVTNLNSAHPDFVFPMKFVVRADAPDEPTETSNVTGFAFMYVEYSANMYGWSPSSPSTGGIIRTLLPMKANTFNLEIANEPDPIRLYARTDLYASTLCMYWDRFAVGTAGGAWSARGIVNDGEGCLTTHLSDIGIFVDGRVPKPSSLSSGESFFDAVLINETNFVVMAVVGFVVLLNSVLTVWGYKRDEQVRDHRRRGKLPNQPYYFDGDGITNPLSVADPIAYRFAHLKTALFAITFRNIFFAQHAMFGAVFFHETFTRPQRLLCVGALMTGVMAINATIYGSGNAFINTEQYLVSGILSALVMFPVFCLFMMMFSTRPTPAKKRLIKRIYNRHEADIIAREKQKIENATTLAPPEGYVQDGRIAAHVPGYKSLLSLPAPLPMNIPPPPPPGRGGGGLLALPAPGGAFTSLPVAGLPALPTHGGGFSALPALPVPQGAPGAKPPPPKYPPPAMFAKAPGPAAGMLPPIFFGPKAVGPPGQLPGQAGSISYLEQGGPRGAGPGAPPPPPPLAFKQDSRLSAALTLQDEAAAYHTHDKAHGDIGDSGGTHHVPPPPPPPAASDMGGTPSAPPPGSVVDDVAQPPAPAALQRDGAHSMPFPEDMPKVPPPPPPVDPMGGVSPGRQSQFSGTRSISEPRTPTGPPPEVSGIVGPDGQYSSMNQAARQRQVAIPPPPPTVAGVLRGQPPAFMPSPLSPPPPPGAEMGLVPFSGGPPGPPGGPGGAMVPQIPPPPPPREDDQAFVRRVRLVYMDRVNREHERQDLDEDPSLGTPTPGWVFSTATLLPYIACAAFTIVAIFVILMYGIKFKPRGPQEENWYWASAIGLGVILFVLEIIRISVMTIVELRRFEIRKRRKAGDFLTRRVKVDDDANSALLKSKPKKHAAPAPSVPKIAPKFSTQRPGFLPKPGPPMPPMLGPPGSSMSPMGGAGLSAGFSSNAQAIGSGSGQYGIGAGSGLSTANAKALTGGGGVGAIPSVGGGGIPVAPGAPKPPPPPGGSKFAPQDRNLPPPIASVGQSRGAPPPPPPQSGSPLMPGAVKKITPPTTPTGATPPPPPPPASGPGPGNMSGRSQGSHNSVNKMSQDLNDKLKSSTLSGKAPPPPPSGGHVKAPPPPSADAPGGRPGNTSARSGGSRGSRGSRGSGMPKPPPPPGKGTFIRGSTPPSGP